MDSASSIEHRIAAMKQVYEAGIRTVCFVSPVFPGITDFEAIFERVKDQCDLFWLENLNLRGGFKKTIMDYIAGKYPDLVPLYDGKTTPLFSTCGEEGEREGGEYGGLWWVQYPWGGGPGGRGGCIFFEWWEGGGGGGVLF